MAHQPIERLLPISSVIGPNKGPAIRRAGGGRGAGGAGGVGAGGVGGVGAGGGSVVVGIINLPF